MNYVERVESNLEGLEYVSTGLPSECETCCDYHDATPEQIERGEVCDEGGFSWSGCGICGSSLGGNRYVWHAVGKYTQEVYHFDDCCTDCVMYLANGDLPEEEDEDEAPHAQ